METPGEVLAVLDASPEPDIEACPPPAAAALRQTVEYLASPAAAAALSADAYWPKWDAPWWRLTLLWELSLLDEAPREAFVHFLAAMRRYLDYFPFRIEDVPEGVDPQMGIICHCGLGTAYQILHAGGVPVDRELPWVRPWFLRYQMQDGGLNCDEAAYVRATPRSSMVSTLPALEAILAADQLSAAETAFLDRGAQYLIARGLCRSISRGGSLMEPSWLSLIFPRFYRYDILRGLSLLVRWSWRLKRRLPVRAIAEALRVIVPDARGRLSPGRQADEGEKTRIRVEGEWRMGGPAHRFALLDDVSPVGQPSRALTKQWSLVRSGLRDLARAGLLAEPL